MSSGLDWWFNEGDKETDLERVIPKYWYDYDLTDGVHGGEGKRRIKDNSYIPGWSSWIARHLPRRGN